MTEAILQRAEAIVADAMPMKRIGQPGELAPAVLFLASEGASYIIGQVIPIDGGRTTSRSSGSTLEKILYCLPSIFLDQTLFSRKSLHETFHETFTKR